VGIQGRDELLRMLIGTNAAHCAPVPLAPIPAPAPDVVLAAPVGLQGPPAEPEEAAVIGLQDPPAEPEEAAPVGPQDPPAELEEARERRPAPVRGTPPPDLVRRVVAPYMMAFDSPGASSDRSSVFFNDAHRVRGPVPLWLFPSASSGGPPSGSSTSGSASARCAASTSSSACEANEPSIF
jgi:hypothetical protein